MRDTLIIAVTVGAFALLGNVAGGYIIASRLSQLAASPERPVAVSSAEVARSRLMADSSRRDRG